MKNQVDNEMEEDDLNKMVTLPKSPTPAPGGGMEAAA